jgi:glycosyltransferase involved in cell wall biosynthesis
MDKDKTLVSIIVPVYNAELYLEECINSILEQTYKNLEIILIDDGSTDNSFEIMKQYSENDSRVQSLSISNSGPGKCRNVGLDIFSGDFVMFVDSDDMLYNDMVEILIKKVNTASDIAMCKFSKDIKTFGTGDKSLVNQTESFIDSVKQMNSPGFASAGPYSKLYGKNIFSKLRFPDIPMYEDSAISLQILSNAKEVVFIDYVGYYYRFNPESITNKKVSEKNFSILDKTDIVLDFIQQEHPEALALAYTICLNDNDYVMMECTRSNTEIARTLFERLLEQNRDLSKNLGMRKLIYTNRLLLKIALKIMSKIYYNDFVRNIFKKVLGVNNG